MPLHGPRDLPVNRGMLGGTKRWGGKTREELKLSAEGSIEDGQRGGQGLPETVHPFNVAPSAVLFY